MELWIILHDDGLVTRATALFMVHRSVLGIAALRLLHCRRCGEVSPLPRLSSNRIAVMRIRLPSIHTQLHFTKEETYYFLWQDGPLDVIMASYGK